MLIAEDASLEKRLRPTAFEDVLCERIFDGEDAYKELVRASEGNPRDFLRLLVNCLKSVEIKKCAKITQSAVTNAAIQHFQNEKLPEIAENEKVHKLFDDLYKLVVQKKSKIFMVSSHVARHDLQLLELWHYRFIHLAMQDLPYVKDDIATDYDIYSLDYGKLVALNPHFSKGVGAPGLRIGESSSATKPYGEAEELPDAHRV